MANGSFKPQGHAFGGSDTRVLIAGWIASMALVAMVAVLVTAYFSGGGDSRSPVADGQAPSTVAEQSSDSSQPRPDAGMTRQETADSETVVKSSPDTRIETGAAGDKSVAASESASAPDESGVAHKPEDTSGKTPFMPGVKLAGAQGLVPMPSAFARSAPSESVAGWCKELVAHVDAVSTDDCMTGSFKDTGHRSVDGRPMIVGDIPATSRPAQGRVLLISATHGDEPSSIATAFSWIKLMASNGTNYEWNVVPTLNPDGALHSPATRVNANGVDLNRNLPTTGWAKESRDYWRRVGFEKRRFPGESAGSEPENRWLADEIGKFKPNVIISLHAPYGVLDYDGEFPPPQKLGRLNLHRLGVYPGSLGNFASHMRGIPVITVELNDANEPPAEAEVQQMWADLNNWLDRYFRNVRQAKVNTSNDAG